MTTAAKPRKRGFLAGFRWYEKTAIISLLAFLTSCILFTAVGIAGAVTAPRTPIPQTEAPAELSPHRLITAPQQRVAETIVVHAHRRDQQRLREFITADVAAHGGIIVGHDAPTSTEYHVTSDYLPRLLKLVAPENTRDVYPYQSWVTAPSSPAADTHTPDIAVAVAVESPVFSRTLYHRISMTLVGTTLFTAFAMTFFGITTAAAIDTRNNP